MGGRYVRCAILGARDGIYFLCIWNSIMEQHNRSPILQCDRGPRRRMEPRLYIPHSSPDVLHALRK